MNRDFTRYQVLPNLDALLVSVKPSKVAVDANALAATGSRLWLSPLPAGEGRGEGKRAARSVQGQQMKSSRT
jgi:hypothetical protein